MTTLAYHNDYSAGPGGRVESGAGQLQLTFP